MTPELDVERARKLLGDTLNNGFGFWSRSDVAPYRQPVYEAWQLLTAALSQGRATTVEGDDVPQNDGEQLLWEVCDLVSLWKNGVIKGLPRAERNAAIEGARAKIIALFDAGAVDKIRAAFATLQAERDAAVAERDELQQTFDLRWDANMRAIRRWQEAHPGNDLVWPDHADLVVWLLETRP